MDFMTAKWPASVNVNTLVTFRSLGDMAGEGRRMLHGLLQKEPVWLRQVHGTSVVDAGAIDRLPRGSEQPPEADAAITRTPGAICAVMVADCMPVFFADESGTTVGVAHAGWRGLAAGVLESTLEAMKVDRSKVLAWLGPAIGPNAYEVGEDVRAAFAGYEGAFVPTRPGHWFLDLYAVARQRLKGVKEIYGGGACTYSDRERYFSYRRDRTRERMAALIWLESRSP